jgi:hypothetical protein
VVRLTTAFTCLCVSASDIPDAGAVLETDIVVDDRVMLLFDFGDGYREPIRYPLSIPAEAKLKSCLRKAVGRGLLPSDCDSVELPSGAVVSF